MLQEDNKTIIRRFLDETMTQGNFEVFETCFAPDLVVRVSGAPTHSHASFRKRVEQFQQAFSGHAITIHDLVAEADTVAVRYSYASPLHHSQFGKNPPTGQPLHLEWVNFFHFEQGKVIDWWGSYTGASFDLSPE